ncbi:hypothetical protein, conserved [Entamoeba dispar SAW760]|uniref:t-SNARE coiled-coil homology domain-containing protein n=1 Tax=Entamoeba dispar (strain ATCC PRA-260 / SAW760) TaxID=370354 RepID=B0ECA8_ENTDS|nr:uncharacterized protein EDI_154540 [Entamoeba dispar SAW760]EDR27832.1 hypothetical protein, conserved [Entamoeba dispar SAW760]|eukprot:EDR27832.1 hypothetical protein, conserved [Entamoeba dispar SAW760]
MNKYLMNRLETTLKIIVEECGISLKENKLNNKEKEGIIDSFTKKRQQIYLQVCDVEKLCDLRVKEDSKEKYTTVVQLTIEIKKKINNIDKMYEELRKEYQEYATEQIKKKKEKDEKLIEYRLSLKTVEEEIETMKMIAKRGIKIKENIHINGIDGFNNSSLPENDDKRIREIEKNDQNIDNKLNIIHEGVKDLKEVANNLNQQVDKQNIKIELITKNVNKEILHLDKKNIKLKKILEYVRGPDQLCCTITILFVIFGIISIGAMILMKN